MLKLTEHWVEPENEAVRMWQKCLFIITVSTVSVPPLTHQSLHLFLICTLYVTLISTKFIHLQYLLRNQVICVLTTSKYVHYAQWGPTNLILCSPLPLKVPLEVPCWFQLSLNIEEVQSKHISLTSTSGLRQVCGWLVFCWFNYHHLGGVELWTTN